MLMSVTNVAGCLEGFEGGGTQCIWEPETSVESGSLMWLVQRGVRAYGRGKAWWSREGNGWCWLDVRSTSYLHTYIQDNGNVGPSNEIFQQPTSPYHKPHDIELLYMRNWWRNEKKIRKSQIVVKNSYVPKLPLTTIYPYIYRSKHLLALDKNWASIPSAVPNTIYKPQTVTLRSQNPSTHTFNTSKLLQNWKNWAVRLLWTSNAFNSQLLAQSIYLSIHL